MLHVKQEDFVAQVPTKMTRREKLLHLANVIRSKECSHISLVHGLEYCDPHSLRQCHIVHLGPRSTPFSIAAMDKTIIEDRGRPMYTMGEFMDYFNLTQSQLHEFSCDCGGLIDNEEMARRIESLA